MEEVSQQFEELAEPRQRSFDWQLYYHAILDRLWLVLLAVVLGLLAAGFFLKNQEVKYGSRSVLIFDQEKRILSKVESVKDVQIRSVDMVNTVVETLRSYPFALRVAKRLGLATSPEFLRAVKSEKADMTPERAASYLCGKSGMVNIQYRKMTRLIDIFATSREPAIATELANGYANEYIRLLVEQSSEASRSAGQTLVEEATRLGEKVRLAEEALQSFRERERTASFENLLLEAQTHVSTISLAISENEQLLAQFRRDIEAAQKSPDDEKFLLQLPSIVNDQQIAMMNASIIQQEAELDLLTQRYMPAHPLYTTAALRLERTKKDRTELVAKIVAQLGVRSDLINQRIKRLQEEKSEAESRLLEVTAKSVEYNSLTRELEADKALYSAVLSRLKEVDLTRSMGDESVKIQELAFGAGPISIQYVKFILVGLLAGLALGVSLALTLHAIDPAIRTVDQAERRTGLKVITAMPQLKEKQPGLITVRERHGQVAEAFRTLRTSVALLGGRGQRQAFLFTSALPSEGKTFSSSNFAATLAQQGFRTLYVDGDLRKPAVSKLFFGENRKPGLTEVLHGTATIAEAVQSGGLDNLSVLTAGGRSESPSELLAGPGVQRFFDQARKEYDRIVVDSAPVVAVSDTLLLVNFTDVNCLVVRAHSTPSKSILHAIRLLEEVGCPPVGIVLNRLKVGRHGSYAYTYSGRVYGNYYGAKGVYGHKE